jgi:hypothetical protein
MNSLASSSKSIRRAAAIALAGGALVAPAAASAETVTIGNALDHSHNFSLGACVTGCTAFQQTQAADATALPLASPVNGLVTAWSVRTTLMGDTYRLRVLRAAGGLNLTFAGSSAVSPPVPNSADAIRDYAAAVPIQQGDLVGLQSVSGTGVPLHTGGPATASDNIAYRSTDAADGTTQPFSTTNGDIKEVLLRATVSFCRVPAVARLKRAAAEAALSAAGCGVKVTTKKLKRTKKGKKRRGKVLTQAPAAGSTVAPGAPVEIKVAKLRKR